MSGVVPGEMNFRGKVTNGINQQAAGKEFSANLGTYQNYIPELHNSGTF